MKKCKKCGAEQADFHLVCSYPYCGWQLEVIPEKTTRERVLEWWNSLTGLEKGLRCPDGRNQGSLTGREIEEIYLKETQQLPERGITITNVEEQPQVDFEKLALLRCNLKHNESVTIYKSDIENLQLLFHLLSTKPTFAKKAYEELSKLK